MTPMRELVGSDPFCLGRVAAHPRPVDPIAAMGGRCGLPRAVDMCRLCTSAASGRRAGHSRTSPSSRSGRFGAYGGPSSCCRCWLPVAAGAASSARKGRSRRAASRFGLGRAVPRWMKWAGWPFVAFAGTTVFGQLVSVYQYPKAALIVAGWLDRGRNRCGFHLRPGEACVVSTPVPRQRRLFGPLAPVAASLPRRFERVAHECGPYRHPSGQLCAAGADSAYDRSVGMSHVRPLQRAP